MTSVPPTHRRAILVIEDQPLVLEVIVGALTSYGFEQEPREPAPDGVRVFRMVDEEAGPVEVVVASVDAVSRTAPTAGMRAAPDADRPLGSLTPRETEVLRLMAQGKTNAEIAQIRGTTVGAVDRALARAFTALGVGRSDAEAPGGAQTWG